MNKKIFLGLMLLIMITFTGCIGVVEYNEFAFEREFGTLFKDSKETGITWYGIGSLVRVNNQVRNYEIAVEAASKDLQDVSVALNLNIQLKEEEAHNFITNYKTEEQYLQYLNNKIQEKVKTIILKYNAGEILNNRLEISKESFEAIKLIPELNYFKINDLALKNIDFSEEFKKTLERNAQIEIEKGILIKQKENLQIMKENMGILDIDTYFKYQLIEKWDGASPMIISDALLYNN